VFRRVPEVDQGPIRTVRHKTALFSNKADPLIQNNLAQKIPRESAKDSRDLEHNQIDNIPTGRFCVKAARITNT
jgi:hypothetical protein